MNLQRQRVMEEKQKLIEEGRRQNAVAQKQLEEERSERLKQRLLVRQQLDDSLRRKLERKEYERQLQAVSTKEQYLLMQEKAYKEIEKEKLYRKHFEDYDRLMAERAKLHMASVSIQESSKARQLNDWILRNEAEYQRKLREKEQQLEEWRRNNAFHTRQILKAQIDQKELERQELRRLRELRMEENMKAAHANSELNLMLRREKTEQQKTYNDVLRNQIRLKNDIVSRYGTMTENERRLNNKNLLVLCVGE